LGLRVDRQHKRCPECQCGGHWSMVNGHGSLVASLVRWSGGRDTRAGYVPVEICRIVAELVRGRLRRPNRWTAESALMATRRSTPVSRLAPRALRLTTFDLRLSTSVFCTQSSTPPARPAECA
jgi:hypothetical protein